MNEQKLDRIIELLEGIQKELRRQSTNNFASQHNERGYQKPINEFQMPPGMPASMPGMNAMTGARSNTGTQVLIEQAKARAMAEVEERMKEINKED